MRKSAAASIICVAVALTCCAPPTRTQPQTVELDYTIRDMENMPVNLYIKYITPGPRIPEEDVIPDSDSVLGRLNADPDNERLKFHYGVALFREHEWEKACPIFDLEYNNEAISGTASYFQSYCRMHFGDLIGSAESLARYAEKERVSYTKARMYSRCGMIYWQSGDREKAVPYFEEALVNDHEEAFEAAYYLGVYRATQGDYEIATELLIQAHEHSPQMSEDLLPWQYAIAHALGVIAFRQGHLQLAREHWEHANWIYPVGEDAKEGLQLLRPRSAKP